MARSRPESKRPTAARTVVVLGGDSDIGRATVERLARDGQLELVVLAVRAPQRVTAPELPERTHVEVLEWDALDVDGHDAFAALVEDMTGGVDLLVCAVGSLGHHAGLSMGPVEVDRMVRTNTSGPAAAVAAFAARMAARGSGRIVVLSSVAGVRPRRSNYVYGSSKAGLDAFARGVADAVVDRGVDVLVVRPGFVRSSMTRGLDPAPFATDPATVAAAISERLARPGGGVLWVPRILGPLFRVLSIVPASWWRRIAADR
jgi:decaprenylphospho-beta-D-erythro-pentofuranosid-2-ulose 2-reductase